MPVVRESQSWQTPVRSVSTATFDGQPQQALLSLLSRLDLVFMKKAPESLLLGEEVGVVHGRKIRDTFFCFLTSSRKHDLDPISRRNRIQKI